MNRIILKAENYISKQKGSLAHSFFWNIANMLGITTLFKEYRKGTKSISFKANIHGADIRFFDRTPTLQYYYSYLNTGAYEPALSRKLKEIICENPSFTFVDLGAHFGYFSLLAAKWINKPGSVFSVEPHPIFFKHHLHNVKINELSKIITSYQIALSDKPGKATMIGKDERIFNEEKEGAVQVSTFDSLCKKENISPDIVKIDVHGAEGKILAGMPEALQKASHIFIETHSDMMGYTINDLIQLLQNAGLSIFEFTKHREAEGGDIIPVSKDINNDHGDRVLYGIRK